MAVVRPCKDCRHPVFFPVFNYPSFLNPYKRIAVPPNILCTSSSSSPSESHRASCCSTISDRYPRGSDPNPIRTGCASVRTHGETRGTPLADRADGVKDASTRWSLQYPHEHFSAVRRVEAPPENNRPRNGDDKMHLRMPDRDPVKIGGIGVGAVEGEGRPSIPRSGMRSRPKCVTTGSPCRSAASRTGAVQSSYTW